MKKCPYCDIFTDDTDETCDICGFVFTFDNKSPHSELNIINLKQDIKTPHCPTCHSTNIKKISTTNKVGSVVTFGVFSIGHVSKTFKCDNCGMKF